MTLNTSDRKSVRAAEKAQALADRQRGEVLINLMSTAPGRRFIWDKLGSAHIFQTSFNLDPGQLAFNEGERNQGLLLLNDIIQYCPEQFIQAMRESNARSSSDNSTGTDPGQRSSGEDGDGGDSRSTGDSADGDSGIGAEAA